MIYVDLFTRGYALPFKVNRRRWRLIDYKEISKYCQLKISLYTYKKS